MSQTIENYFVCIGAQKAGTTWLARMLAHHPDIFQTPVKEIHYFDHMLGITDKLSRHKRRSRLRKYYLRMATQWGRFQDYRKLWRWYRAYMRDPLDDGWYAALFAERGSARFAGEVTPEYAITGQAGFEHIKRLAPQARVIYIMRNPVTQAWSQLLHECRKSGLDAASLSLKQATAVIGSRRYLPFADYLTTLDNLAKVFAPEQTLILFFEDIHKDRQAALEKICHFIGTGFEPRHFPDFARRYNPSQEAILPDALRAWLRDENRAKARAILARTGRLPDNWRAEFKI